MQTDPAGYSAGMNLYAYVAGDPVNLVDPSGMDASSDADAKKCKDAGNCTRISFTGGNARQLPLLEITPGENSNDNGDDVGIDDICDGCGYADPKATKLSTEILLGVTAAGATLVAGEEVLAEEVSVPAVKATEQPETETVTVTSIKIQNQMEARGWTSDLINSTISKPAAIRRDLNKANLHPATAYFRSDGSYLVRDDLTRDVVQISKIGDPTWTADQTIVNPYKP